MLFPLGTDQPIRRAPAVTTALIAVNVGVFLVQTFLQQTDPDAARRFVQAGWIWGQEFRWHALVTAAFMHAGLWHLFGNMLALWAFGPSVEDRFGHTRFLVFYLAGGAASMGLHAAFSPNPAVGASGAIASVTGAFLVMFPFVAVKCFNLIFLAITWLPGWWWVGFGIIWDILMHTGRAGTRTAHLAHLGGYAWGIGLCLGLIGLGLMQRRPYDLFTFAQQMHRRRQIRAAVRGQQDAMAARFERAKADQRGAEESDAIAEARAVVTRHLARNEFEQARRAYRELAERHDHVPGATVLARRHQYTLASAYYQAGDAEGAAYAFGKFLQGFPTDPEAPQIRLLLGLLYARSLNDPVKAKALIAEAINGLDENGREMARRELNALG